MRVIRRLVGYARPHPRRLAPMLLAAAGAGALTGVALGGFATTRAQVPFDPPGIPPIEVPTPTPTPEVPPAGTPTRTTTPAPSATPTPPKPAGANLPIHTVVGGLTAEQGRLTALPGTGCAGPSSAGTVVQALVSGGYVRTYRVHLPPQTAAGRALPVILNFHALASNGFVQEGLSGLVPLADREGLIVVSPDGLGAPTGWNALMNADSGVDDVQFVADLIARLKQDYCVDTRAVYATGFSNGAMLAARVGCRLSHMIAAIVPVAGVYAPPSSEICLRPVPILAIHGMHDTVVPFDGGLIIGTVPYEGARQAVKTWAGRNPRCEQAVDRTVLSPGVALESYRACSPSEVGLLVLENVGHAPPDETSSPELMWSFMRRHQLPR